MQTGNKLFWDLDESLIHTFYADSEKHADQLMDLYSEYWKGVKYYIRHDGWYVSFLRNGALELLEFTRNLAGFDNVNMLSIGGKEYILWANVKMGLGFDPNFQIFGKEDIATLKVHPKFKDTHNILIDDMSFAHHIKRSEGNNKIDFLSGIPKNNLIQIPKFTVWVGDVDKNHIDQFIDETKNRITRAIFL
jgi:hypothetical protein